MPNSFLVKQIIITKLLLASFSIEANYDRSSILSGCFAEMPIGYTLFAQSKNRSVYSNSENGSVITFSKYNPVMSESIRLEETEVYNNFVLEEYVLLEKINFSGGTLSKYYRLHDSVHSVKFTNIDKNKVLEIIYFCHR